MSKQPMDINAYLARMAYTGSRVPSFATLRDLQLAHLYTVPFENLDVHLGREITLDLAAIYHKIIEDRRGGFCYEVNGLFGWLLEALGFTVTRLSASDAHADGSYGPEFDHLILMVELPGEARRKRWLADVGWGDTFVNPLDIDATDLQEEGNGRAYQIEHSAEWRILNQRNYDGSWERQYGFTMQPRQYSDFAGMCHYHQTAPESPFTQKRIVTRATLRGRLTLREQHTTETVDGVRTERELQPGEYNRLLGEWFGIHLPTKEH